MKVSMFTIFVSITFCFQSSWATVSPNPVEKKVRWIWSQTLPFLKACLSADDCPLTPAEKNYASQIVSNESYYSDQTLLFVSEAERPDLFTSTQGEAHRLMMTGSTPRSPIYINSTRVLDPQANLSLEALVGLFGHELIHHLGVTDDAQRIPDQFGVKLTNLFQQHLIPVDLSDSHNQIFVLNMPSPLMPQYHRDFPNGLHPRLVLTTQSQFIGQDYQILAERSREICATGDLWYSQVSVSHVSEGKDQGRDAISVEMKLLARCFLPEKNTLQEAASYLVNRFKINSTDGKVEDATFIWDKNSIDQTSAQGLQVISMNHALEANAGGSLEVEATVALLYSYDIKGCAGQFTSPIWVDKSAGIPLVANTTDCQILSQTGNQFHLKFKIQIPNKAPAGLQIKVNQIYLQTKSNQYVLGRPAQAPLIQIKSDAKSSFEFKGITFPGANKLPVSLKNAYYINRGQPFQINFQFSGATELIDGSFGQVLNLIDRTPMFSYIPFVGQSSTPRKISVDAQGLLNITAQIDPQHLAPKEVIQLYLQYFVALTSNWEYLSVDLEPYEYAISAVVPR